MYTGTLKEMVVTWFSCWSELEGEGTVSAHHLIRSWTLMQQFVKSNPHSGKDWEKGKGYFYLLFLHCV